MDNIKETIWRFTPLEIYNQSAISCFLKGFKNPFIVPSVIDNECKAAQHKLTLQA